MSEHSGILAIIGAGGFAAEVIDAARASGWKQIALYDDDPAKHGTQILDVSCMGSVASLVTSPRHAYILAVGRNDLRQKISAQLESAGHHPTTVRHPACIISPSARIAPGAFLAPLAWIGPNVVIGCHALINVSVSVGHDAVLGDWVQLCPGVRVSGGAILGCGSFVGSNAVVAPKITIGDWSQVGANSFAWREVPAGKLAVGTPARIVEKP